MPPPSYLENLFKDEFISLYRILLLHLKSAFSLGFLQPLHILVDLNVSPAKRQQTIMNATDGLLTSTVLEVKSQ